MRYPQERIDSDVRVSTVTGAIHRALVGCIRAEPDLTEEELLTALIAVAARKTQRLRGQSTPTAGVGGAVPSAWVAAFDEAVAAVGCVSCGSTKPCRCYVPADKRESKTAAGLSAVLPLMAAVLNDGVDADADR